jgi:WD40 repeat protein/serine/threonine protein kinase
LASHADYEIRRELGRGGMGVVYLAHNRLVDRDEVLKVMGRHIIERPGVMERFLREIRAVGQLRHPNIVAAYTAFRSGESLVFAMEYVEGLDLARMVRARGPMPVGNACSYIHQASLGLQHAHEQGMVHRDIKPGNLMLSRSGDRALIKVLDFGLAKAGRENRVVDLSLDRAEQAQLHSADLTLAGQMLGTPAFIAPEQIDDAKCADIRADIYSLGCTLYYLLSGGPPFQAETLYDVLQAHHSKDARSLNFVRPEVPAELAALVAKMMAKEPARRFQTPGEVARALHPFFKRTSQPAMQSALAVDQVHTPGASVSTSGGAGFASTSPLQLVPSSAVEATLQQYQPEEMWKSLISLADLQISETAPVASTQRLRGSRRRLWPYAAVLAGLMALLAVLVINYRMATDTGELLIETEDPDAQLIVKQRGRRVMIVAPRSKKRITLISGDYELELQDNLPELRLSTERITIKRGHWTIAAVLHKPATNPRPNAELPTEETTQKSALAEGLRFHRPGTGSSSNSQPLAESAPGSGDAITVLPEAKVGLPPRVPPSVKAAGEGREDGLVGHFEGSHGPVACASLLPDGRVIYVTCGDHHGGKPGAGGEPAVWIGDSTNPKRPTMLKGHAEDVTSIAVSKDGKLALTTSLDRTLRLWDLDTGKSRRIRHEAVGLGSACFSPDERRAAYAGGGTIYLCFLKTGREQRRFQGDGGGRIIRVVFSPDGGRLVSCGVDKTIRVWSLETGQELRRIANGAAVTDIAIFPDGRRAIAASSDQTITIWDLETGNPLRRMLDFANGTGGRVAISPDGLRALFARSDNAWLWDVETGEAIRVLNGQKGISCVGFSPDGLRAVTAATDASVRIWALPPGRPPGYVPPLVEVSRIASDQFVQTASISPDGERVLSEHDNNGVARLWDLHLGQEILGFSGHARRVVSTAFSPNGQLALTGDEDGVVRMWDTQSGKPLGVLHSYVGWVFNVAFSPDGRLAYSTGGGDMANDALDPSVHVWDVETGKEKTGLRGHTGRVLGLAVSPDGDRILTGGGTTLILWNARTFQEVRRWQGHSKPIKCLAFLPNGRRAASTSDDGTIRLWDVDSGKEIRQFGDRPMETLWLAVSNKGRHMLSSHQEKHELRLWDLDTGNLLQKLHWGPHDSWEQCPMRGMFSTSSPYAAWGGGDRSIRIYRLTDDSNALASENKRPGRQRARPGKPL